MNGLMNTGVKPADLFKTRMFRVPSYQRGYAWEKDQWDEFLEDIELLATGAVHYTGTVVLNAASVPVVKDQRGNSYEVFDIVDGQQRLTTMVLLLDAIRRELATANPHLAEGLGETYIHVLDRNGIRLPKLALNADSQDFFFHHILCDEPDLTGPRIRSHRNLSGAKEHFRVYLSEQKKKRPDDFAPWLEALREKVCEQLQFTVYPVQRTAEAGVIFEVMNNRGRPITELEKSKNYLLYMASKLELPDDHRLDEQIVQTWGFIFEQLMANGLSDEQNEDQLLRSHWLMAYDYNERHWNGSKSLKAEFHLRKYVGRHQELLKALIEYVRSLRNAASAYCDIANPKHPQAFADLSHDATLRQRVVQQAIKLPRLHIVAPFLPLLMAARLRFPGEGACYLRILELCETFAFRVYRLLQRRPQTGRSNLFLLGNGLYSNQFTAGEVFAGLLSLTLKHSPQGDVDYRLELKDDKNDWYNWRGISYFLYEYEAHLAVLRHKSMAIGWAELDRGDAKEHTIEHILPQSPVEDYWLSRFSETLRRRYTHDLGNLCLTRDNSSYGRKPFPEKRGRLGSGIRCYADGDLVMERDLGGLADWDEDQLLARRATMVAWAKDRWGIPLAAKPAVIAAAESEEEDTDDPEMDTPTDDPA